MRSNKTKSIVPPKPELQPMSLLKPEPVEIGKLRPHPRQAELVGDMNDLDFVGFAADIGTNGIREPLTLMADGVTVVCGHQRLRAAELHGFAQVPCRVHGDLIDPDDPEVLKLLLGDNLHRRQLSKLQQAKSAIKLAEIECDRRKMTHEVERKRLIEKAVALWLSAGSDEASLRKCHKNVQRYINVAKAPEAIQEAFERGFVPLVKAAAVANLEQGAQDILGNTVAKILKQMAAQGEKAYKDNIMDAVHTALIKTKKQRRKYETSRGKAAPSPLNPLVATSSSLGDGLGEVVATHERIVTHINDADEVSKALYLCTVTDLRKRLEHWLDQVSLIEAAIDSGTASAEPANDESASRTSCPVNHAIAVTCV
jgi:hypothetical protein